MHVAEEYTDAASRPSEEHQDRLLGLFLERQQARQAMRVTLAQGRYCVTFDPRSTRVIVTTEIQADSGRSIRGVRELDVAKAREEYRRLLAKGYQSAK